MRNKISLIGTVYSLNVKEYKLGKKKALITLQVDDSYKSDGKRVYRDIYIDLVAWSHLAAIIDEYAPVGREIGLEAKFVKNKFKDVLGKQHFGNQMTITDLHFFNGDFVAKEKADESS